MQLVHCACISVKQTQPKLFKVAPSIWGDFEQKAILYIVRKKLILFRYNVGGKKGYDRVICFSILKKHYPSNSKTLMKFSSLFMWIILVKIFTC